MYIVKKLKFLKLKVCFLFVINSSAEYHLFVSGLEYLISDSGMILTVKVLAKKECENVLVTFLHFRIPLLISDHRSFADISEHLTKQS